MHSMDNQGQDIGAQLGNLIQLQNLQRLNAARPAIIQSLTGGSSSGVGGMDPNVLNALPTDQLQKLLNDRVAAGLGIQTKGAETKQADLIESQTKLPDAVKAMGDVTNRINDIESATNADGSPVLQGILSNNSKKNAAMALMSSSEDPGWVASHWQQWQERGLTQQEISTIMNMKQLSSQGLRGGLPVDRLAAHPAGSQQPQVRPEPDRQHQPALRRRQRRRLFAAIEQIQGPAQRRFGQFLRRRRAARRDPRQPQVRRQRAKPGCWARAQCSRPCCENWSRCASSGIGPTTSTRAVSPPPSGRTRRRLKPAFPRRRSRFAPR